MLMKVAGSEQIVDDLEQLVDELLVLVLCEIEGDEGGVGPDDCVEGLDGLVLGLRHHHYNLTQSKSNTPTPQNIDTAPPPLSPLCCAGG